MQLKIIILFCSAFLINGCDNPVNQNTSNLQLSFKNVSSYQLNNLVVADKLIGNLTRGQSSVYRNYEKFSFDSGLPDEDAGAEVNGILYTNYYRGYWCGTEKMTVDSGRFLIEVDVLDTTLYLSCKNPPRIDYH